MTCFEHCTAGQVQGAETLCSQLAILHGTLALSLSMYWKVCFYFVALSESFSHSVSWNLPDSLTLKEIQILTWPSDFWSTWIQAWGQPVGSPFSEDCCASDQRQLFPMLSNHLELKIILIYLLAGGGGWSWTQMLQLQLYNLITGHITCYISSRKCYIAPLPSSVTYIWNLGTP